MHLNMYRPNPFYASEDTKCISTSFDKPIPRQEKKKVSQPVLTKTIPCQWGHKMDINKC
jgi:hypothetical protein